MSLSQFAVQTLNALLTVGAIVTLVISLVMLAECLASLLPGKGQSTAESLNPNSKAAILVPAHNEASGIGATLQSILPQLRPCDRLIVIADNCTDTTAAIARDFGATVLERTDLLQRGKGYALHYGLQSIAADPPDVVIFVDADCHCEESSIPFLIQRAIAANRPVQGKYLMKKPPGGNQKSAISAFSSTVRNWIRPRGLARLNLPFLLTGSGMAFPWEVIRSVELASGNIVEDLKLGLDLAIANHSPVFCEEATIISPLPTQKKAATTQRTRWIHGHLQSIVAYVPQLTWAAITQRRLGLLMLALDLAVLPLTLFILLWLGLIVFAGAGLLVGASWLPLFILLGSGLLLFSAILISWSNYGLEDLSLSELLAIPGYTLSRIPIFLKFTTRRESKWVRTER